MIVIDDDVDLPPRFLDRMLALCERLALDLAQPAQTMRSHAAWRVTRRRPWSLARRTQYVEIGPVTLFRRAVAQELMPFPELRFGWGLDNHWGALARERGWRLGVVDALPVRHEFQEVATAYTHAEAIDEARAVPGRAGPTCAPRKRSGRCARSGGCRLDSSPEGAGGPQVVPVARPAGVRRLLPRARPCARRAATTWWCWPRWPRPRPDFAPVPS